MAARTVSSGIYTSWTVPPPRSREACDASGPENGARGAVTGVGIDFEQVARFTGEAGGPSAAFISRVFGERERATYNGNPAAAALGFTAKEAIGKALGSGLCLRRGPGVPCQDIEVLVDLAARRVTVELHGAAAVRAARLEARRGLAWCWWDANLA